MPDLTPNLLALLTADERALAEKARAATPGEWSVGHTRRAVVDHRLGEWWDVPVHVGTGGTRGNAMLTVQLGGPGATSREREAVEANAAHIAAAHPAMVLTLLGRLAEARRLAPKILRDQADTHRHVADHPTELTRSTPVDFCKMHAGFAFELRQLADQIEAGGVEQWLNGGGGANG